MNDGALFSEIETAIDVALSGGGTAPASWITQAVMDRHPGIDGPDAAWMENQARRYVRRCVQKVLSRDKASEDKRGDHQLILSGFDYLQKRYTFERDGEQVVVSIEHATLAELRGRADELDRMAVGCQRHANEMRRYVDDTEAQAAA